MVIRELYLEALKHNHKALILLIDFLVNEKKVHTLTDDTSVLDKYFLPQHRERMNRLLVEYERSKAE